MYVVLAVIVQALLSIAAASLIAPYSLDPTSDSMSLTTLCMASAVVSGIGLFSTAVYLSKRIRPLSGGMIGLACGLLCTAMIGLATKGIDFSLILYLAILAPTLLAVLLATLLDQPKSGWQVRP
jgi:hypothetical protein